MTGRNNRQNTPENAFILAAGKGTRLRPHTDNLPKPMVSVHGKPIIEHIVNKLQKHGIKKIIINLYYFGDRIKNYFKDRKEPKLIFSEETVLLDTGGGVKNALSFLDDKPFYLINGDAFWEDGERSAFERLTENWNSDTMDILLLLQPINKMVLTEGVGDYDLLENGQAVRTANKTGAYMFAGIRITKPSLFENSPEGAFSFLELMDKTEKKGRLYGLEHDGTWHHISTPTDLENVNANYKETKTA